MERVFNLLKADPIVAIAALSICALAGVFWMLMRSYKSQLVESRKQVEALTASVGSLAKTQQDAVAAEVQKRIDLAMTVVAFQTRTGAILDESMATLTSIDDILPSVLSQLERLGVRRRPGTTGSHPVVKPEKTGA